MTDEAEAVATLVVMRSQPNDASAFEADYLGHLPLARQIPGVRALRVSALRSPTHYKIAELVFGTLGELRAGMRSDEGTAVAADAVRLAQLHGMQSDSHVALLELRLAGVGE